MTMASEPKFIIRCLYICKSVSAIWVIARGICRKANKQLGKCWPCRCSRNSPRPSRATSWSRFRTFIRDLRLRLFESHSRARAFADFAAKGPTALFRGHASQLPLAILDLAQLAQDLSFFLHVIFFG